MNNQVRKKEKEINGEIEEVNTTPWLNNQVNKKKQVIKGVKESKQSSAYGNEGEKQSST